MNSYSHLIKIALLGTRRGHLEPEPGESPLDHFWHKLPSADSEHHLLSAAASATLYQRIGSPPLILPQPPPAETPAQDNRPPANAQITRLLSTMISGPRRSYLPEFLLALNRAGWRLPPRLLPNLLSLGFKTSALRPLIIPLLSPSGRFLADKNPQWLYASSQVDTWRGARAIWQRSSPVSKTRFLQQLRVTQPALARQLLQSTWKSEQDSARTNFTKQLEAGLSLGDEPFLESTLDDRNQVVRRRAAELLAALPGSRLSRRMISYTKEFLSWNTAAAITVRFPEVTPAMVRDGIYGSHHKNPAYVRSRQLIQMVGAVPLQHWTENWHHDPAQIIQATLNTNWKRTLTTAFADAAYRQKNERWARTILWARGPQLMSPKLVEVLNTADYLAWLEYLEQQGLGGRDLNFSGPLFKSIRARHSINNSGLARKMLSLIAGYMSQTPAQDKANISAKRTFMAIAYRLPVEALDQVEAVFGDPDPFNPPWQSTAQNIVQTVRFRSEMLQKVALKE